MRSQVHLLGGVGVVLADAPWCIACVRAQGTTVDTPLEEVKRMFGVNYFGASGGQAAEHTRAGVPRREP